VHKPLTLRPETRTGASQRQDALPRHDAHQDLGKDPWEVVQPPEDQPDRTADNDPKDECTWLQSHFDFTVGWGRWKYTLFQWDVDVEIRDQREPCDCPRCTERRERILKYEPKEGEQQTGGRAIQ